MRAARHHAAPSARGARADGHGVAWTLVESLVVLLVLGLLLGLGVGLALSRTISFMMSVV